MSPAFEESKTAPQEPQQVVVVGPDGQPMGSVILNEDGSVDAGGGAKERERGPADMVEQPAKVMRIGSMVKQLLEEVRSAPLDEAARTRLREIHQTSVQELGEGLAPELREELDRLSLPFGDETVPSDAELRIAQAQLVGWLEGLFHGIQTAMVAQQMAARMELERAGGGRPQLPGAGGPGGPGGPVPGGPAGGTGQYL
jgi:hypothetical protein